MNERKILNSKPFKEEAKKTKCYISTFKPDLQFPKKKDVSILMPISIGWEHCEGEQLISELKLVNSVFSGCTGNSEVVFLIASTLRRFNYQAEGKSSDEAFCQSVKDSKEWLEENKLIIERELKNIKYRFIDWEELKKQESFKENEFNINKKYETDQYFRRQFSQTATDFLRSQIAKNDIIIEPQTSLNFCILYVKEECALQITAVKSIKPDYIFYPRSISSALSVTHEVFLKEEKFTYFHIVNRDAPKLSVIKGKKSSLTHSTDFHEKEIEKSNKFVFFRSSNNKSANSSLCEDSSSLSSSPSSSSESEQILTSEEIIKKALSAILSVDGADLRSKIFSAKKFLEDIEKAGSSEEFYSEPNQDKQKKSFSSQ